MWYKTKVRPVVVIMSDEVWQRLTMMGFAVICSAGPPLQPTVAFGFDLMAKLLNLLMTPQCKKYHMQVTPNWFHIPYELPQTRMRPPVHPSGMYRRPFDHGSTSSRSWIVPLITQL